jgi:ankyrin repeat protein
MRPVLKLPATIDNENCAGGRRAQNYDAAMKLTRSHRLFRRILFIFSAVVFFRPSADVGAQDNIDVNAFFSAIENNDTNTVFKVLDANTNFVCADYVGRRPLHVAAQKGCVEIAGRLLKAGANIDEENDSLDTSNCHLTALDIAIWYNQPAVCRLLINAGANPNMLGYHDGCALRLAFIFHHPEMAGWLLDHGANPFLENTQVYTTPTPIDDAIAQGQGKMVPRMLEIMPRFAVTMVRTNVPPPRYIRYPSDKKVKSASEVFAERCTGWLAAAAQHGEPEAVEALFKAGVTVSNAPDGLTVMQAFAQASVAAQNSRPGAEQRLHDVQERLKQDYISHADKNFVDSLRNDEKNAEAAVAAAAPERWQKVLDLLVKHHAFYDALSATARDDTNQISRLLSGKKDTALTRDFAGNTTLHWAVRNDRLRLVSFWIQAGTPLDATNSAGQTALHLAAQDGKIEFVKILLAAHAPTDIRDTNGWTALDAAIHAKQPDAIHLLMADKTAPAHPERGSAITLHKAAATGNVAALAVLVETETNLDARNELGLTPLHVAGQAGQLGAAAFLIDQGADVNARDPDGNTVLHQILISRTHWVKGRPSDAWVEERRKKNPSQEKFWRVYNTPSGYTSPRELAASVAFFLACGADRAATNHAGQTILQLVTADSTMLWDYDRNAILPLLQQSGNGLNERDADGNTALHRLCTGFYDISKTEQMAGLIDSGADVNATNNLGQTPLHIAAEKIGLWDNNNPPVNAPFQLLIYKKAKVNTQDNEGRTPLHVLAAADSSFKKEATRLLLDAGADANHRDILGRTPIHLFLAGKWPWSEAVDCIDTLISAGADLSAKDKQGRTALHYFASLGGNDPMFFMRGMDNTFVLAKVDFNARDNDGNTPLHLAGKYGTQTVFDWLLKQGADLDATNNAGETPRQLEIKSASPYPRFESSGEFDIYEAIRSGKLEAVASIVKSVPSELNKMSRFKQTPLMLATQLHRTNIVDFLDQQGAKWDCTSAIFASRTDILKKLIAEQPKQVTNSSLLRLAATEGNLSATETLLAAGADVKSVDAYGLSALGCAASGHHDDVAELLVKNGAVKNVFDAVFSGDANAISALLARDKSLARATSAIGLSPAEIAAATGNEKTLELLLAQGVPPNFRNARTGESLLFLAAKYDQTNTARLLIRRRAKLDDFSNDGLAPIHIAAVFDSAAVLDLLLEHKADINLRTITTTNSQPYFSPRTSFSPRSMNERMATQSGKTPLHLAVMAGQTNAIALLIKRNASVAERDDDGFTPIDAAEPFEPVPDLFIFRERARLPFLRHHPVSFTSRIIQRGTIITILEQAGAKRDERTRPPGMPFAMRSTMSISQQAPAAGDGLANHNRGCSEFNAHNFTNALSLFIKSRELGSEFQDYTCYRIWIIRARLGERDAATRELADYLEHRKPGNTNDWPLQIGRFLAGQSSESNFLAAAYSPVPQTSKEQHCEAWFYSGSKHLIERDEMGAVDNFKKCLTTGLQNFEEYTSANAELLFIEISRRRESR